MEELLFYTVDKNYIKYLSKFESHVSYNPLTIIKFSAMIPVPKRSNVIKLLEYNEQDKKYKDLVSAEYRYINSNKQEIYKRAQKMYIAVTKHKNNFLKTIACDFKLLEKKSLKYK